MFLNEPFLFAVNIATLTLLGFNASLLITKSEQNSGYLALAISFISILLVISQPSLKQLAPTLQLPILVLSLPALLLIAPCFWLYVKALTADKKWYFSKQDRWHFILPLLGLFISIITLMLPNEIQQALLVKGDESILAKSSPLLRNSIYAGLIITFTLVLSWVVQSAYYIIQTAKRLSHYRTHLKNIFASTEKKEMHWLSALAIFVGIPWGIVAVNIVLDNVFFPNTLLKEVSGIFLLLFTLFVATWGLRQKPGFQEVFDKNDQQAPEKPASESSTKYKTSALSKPQSQQIAQKIENAMTSDELFLDANLSLPKLAKHINTSPNYISQTLNEALDVNFFDCVNRYRVLYAQDALLESNSTVLDIAMKAGFNSKSAFYTAFKKHTGLTPIQYKKNQTAVS